MRWSGGGNTHSSHSSHASHASHASHSSHSSHSSDLRFTFFPRSLVLLFILKRGLVELLYELGMLELNVRRPKVLLDVLLDGIVVGRCDVKKVGYRIHVHGNRGAGPPITCS